MNKGTKTLILILLILTILIAAILLWQGLRKHECPSFTETEALLVPTQPEQPLPTQPLPLETASPETEVTETQSLETEPPEDPVQLQAERILAGMTQYEKLCQLMIVNPNTITGVSPTLQAGDTSRAALEKYPVCGFSFAQSNLRDREQVVSMLEGFQQMSQIPLLFCLDEEGGTVWRLMKNSQIGTTEFDSMFNYREQGGETAYENAKTIAQDIFSLGFNVDFAPVADVWSNPDNTVIGKRAYSDSFSEAAELIPHAVAGFRDGGVICTLKHFPGHGCTVEDSHEGLAIVDRTAEELRENELLPFIAGIEAGADMVMVGHLKVDALDTEYPATLSYSIVTELLRSELGFDGVVITDSLGMGALNAYTETEKCIYALNAGCDILLGVQSPESTLQGLQAAVEHGTITEQRIDESVLRILKMKIAHGIIPAE